MNTFFIVDVLNCCYFVEFFEKLSELIEFLQKNKFDEWTPSSCMALDWGYWAQNAVKVVKFIKIACFQWS
jgi:hypothetical protein